MASFRAQRIDEQVRRAVEEILCSEVKDPGLTAMVSVVRADVTRDLMHAKIHVTMIGTEEEKERSREAIKRAVGFIRRSLANKVDLRRVPDLTFVWDNSIEYAVSISQKIDEVLNEH